MYPEKGKVKEAIETLEAFNVGKPVVIEETFPLKAPLDQFEDFLVRAEKHSAGVIGFYWGTPLEELKNSKTIGDAFLRAWSRFFKNAARRLA